MHVLRSGSVRAVGMRTVLAAMHRAAWLACVASACTPRPVQNQSCARHSDCTPPLRCIDRVCVAECAASIDCPTGQVCVPRGTARVCEAPDASMPGDTSLDTAADAPVDLDGPDAPFDTSRADSLDDVASSDALADGVEVDDVADVAIVRGSASYVALRTGRLQVNFPTTDWETARRLPTAPTFDDGTRYVGSFLQMTAMVPSVMANSRLALRFPPLSTIPAGARIVGANVAFVPNAVDDTPPQTLILVAFSATNPTGIVSADYAFGRWGTTEFGSVEARTLLVGRGATISLNAAGLAALSRTQPNDLGLRTHYDLRSITPGPSSSAAAYGGIVIRPCCTTTAPEEVRLVVDYEVP